MASSSDPVARRRAAAHHLRTQAQWCHHLGSPLYGALLERAAADCELGGAAWSILEPQADEPLAAAVALRLMGAVHRLVLEGAAPSLARHYPSAGGAVGNIEEAWQAFRTTLADHAVALRDLARAPVQTNEVGRSAVLFGGFLEIARNRSLPLRLLEIGAAAGLNLRWDRYRYEAGDAGWGDEHSAVRFAPTFDGQHPALDVRVAVAERHGCDPHPLDPSSEADRTTLRAYLWPDQIARRQRLDAALEIARSLPVRIEAMGAGDWLGMALAASHDGVATVVFHSITMQYIAAGERARIREILHDAGSRTTATAPLAWLRFEPRKSEAGDLVYRLDLTQWPGADTRTLALSSPHGPPVRWLATTG